MPHQTTIKRIHREIADLKKEDLGAIRLEPSDDSLFLWTATIPGPEGSVYEGGVFDVEIQLAHDYPYVLSSKSRATDSPSRRFSPPRMTFKTRYVLRPRNLGTSTDASLGYIT